MIAAGAAALEHVNDIGQWLAESLAASVLDRAFEAHRPAYDRENLSQRLEALMTEERAQEIVHQHSDAVLIRLPLCDGAVETKGWLLNSPKLDEPVMFTDAGLIDYATKLDRIFA